MMTEQDIRNIVEFVRSRQPRFSTTPEEGNVGHVTDDTHFFVSLYDRRSQLLEGSREYDTAMDEVYIKSAMNYFNYDETPN